MKSVKFYLLLAPASLVFSQTVAPVSWDALANPPQTARLQIWRGDTVPLAPRWGTADTNAWTFVAYWSTNNTAWWTKGLSGSCDISGDPFCWTPDMDVGARKYKLFIKASNTGGSSYRANADIAMLDSPGTSPASLPAPDAWPSLASEVLPFMLPYLPTYAAWTNETNARAAADLDLLFQIEALAASGGASTGVVSAASSESALRLRSADSNWWVSLTPSGTATLYVAYVTNWVSLSPAYSDLWPSGGGTQAFPFASSTWQGFVATDPYAPHYAAGDYVVKYIGSSGTTFDDGYWSCPPPSGEETPMTFSGAPIRNPPGTGTMHRAVVGTASGTYATRGDLSSFQSNTLAAADTRIASATNAIVQTYLVGTNAWLTADFSNATLTVTMVVGGITNTLPLQSSGASIDPQATNLIWLAIAANHSALLSALSDKAPKDWGRYAPDGSSNPDPAYMVWLNTPATVLASGASWTTYGTYAALTTSGTVAFETGGDGALHIGPDQTNWFGYVTGGSVTVGAVPGSISVTQGGTPSGVANITFPYSGGDFPALFFSPSLAVSFTEMEGVVWVGNTNGTATVTAPATASAGFYRACTSASFSSYFKTTMPCRLSGGVFGDTNSLPVVYDSVITVGYGGKTYRLPAQEVQ